MGNIFLEILDSNEEIETKILKAIAVKLNNKIEGQINRIRDDISINIVKFLQETATYESLVFGELALHFGLPVRDRQQRIDAILNTVGRNIEIEYRPIKVVGKNFITNLQIGVLIKYFVDILSMSEAYVYTSKGYELPWLEWLLLRGDAIIVSNHEIKFFENKGRSGNAIMIKNNAGIWRVPIQYSGTIGSNWLIRAFTDNINGFLSIIENVLKRALL
jgi:hypothetical protein